jgi:DNA polymerase I-like protein with 3'-5' exonuclease and polymerase domains
MQLEEFEFKWRDGYGDIDPLAFDTDTIEPDVPEDLIKKYTRKLRQNPFKKKGIYEEAYNEGIIITDNGGKIADATRQVVNSRVQGSAADMSKIAGINIYNNKRLRELGFRLLVPIHDEYLAECPEENAKECAELFSQCMCEAAKDLDLPISVDVEITKKWYGERIEI